MDEFLLNEFTTYGPFAVFLMLMLSGVGIPLGEDVVVIPAGVMVGEGKLPLLATLLCAYLGVVVSDVLWFAICQNFGSPLLHKRWFKRFLHPRRLLEAKHEIEQRGVWVIVIARFIPGSRTPAITMAGVLHLPFWQFTLATSLCVLITAPLQLGLGMLISHNIGTEDSAHAALSLLAVIAVITCIPLLVKWIKIMRKSDRPRAKAKWLRRFRVSHLQRRKLNGPQSSSSRA